MPTKDGAEVRKERLNTLLSLIDKHQDDPIWTRKKLVGVFMLQTGLTPKKIEEYLESFLDLGLIDEVDGRLTMPNPIARKVSP